MRKHLKDYFIPHEGNDYKPHSLQKAAMTGMVVLVLISFTLANVQSMLMMASDWMVGAVLPAVIVDMINTERSDGSLGKLARNPALDAAAQMKANDMSKYEYFAHFSPTGVSPWYFFNKAQYNFVNAGENLAVHFTDTKQLVDAWIASPTHRANIMNGAYTETGIGIAEGEFEGYKTLYVVQFFGTPAGVPKLTPSRIIPVTVAKAQETTPIPVVLAEATTKPESPVKKTVAVQKPAETEVLSESVQISEIVEVVQADPVPVVVKKEVISQMNAPSTTETNALPQDVRESMYSDFLATTTGGIPASIDPTIKEVDNNTSYFLKILTQPQVILQVVYLVLGLLILISLILSVVIEVRKQHPVQIAYCLALLLMMFGLFQIQIFISAGATIL